VHRTDRIDADTDTDPDTDGNSEQGGHVSFPFWAQRALHGHARSYRCAREVMVGLALRAGRQTP
jgi:hypothetical protein